MISSQPFHTYSHFMLAGDFMRKTSYLAQYSDNSNNELFVTQTISCQVDLVDYDTHMTIVELLDGNPRVSRNIKVERAIQPHKRM